MNLLTLILTKFQKLKRRLIKCIDYHRFRQCASNTGSTFSTSEPCGTTCGARSCSGGGGPCMSASGTCGRPSGAFNHGEHIAGHGQCGQCPEGHGPVGHATGCCDAEAHMPKMKEPCGNAPCGPKPGEHGACGPKPGEHGACGLKPGEHEPSGQCSGGRGPEGNESGECSPEGCSPETCGPTGQVQARFNPGGFTPTGQEPISHRPVSHGSGALYGLGGHAPSGQGVRGPSGHGLNGLGPSGPEPIGSGPSGQLPSGCAPSEHGPNEHGPSAHGSSVYRPSGPGASGSKPSGPILNGPRPSAPRPSGPGPAGQAPFGPRSSAYGPSSYRPSINEQSQSGQRVQMAPSRYGPPSRGSAECAQGAQRVGGAGLDGPGPRAVRSGKESENPSIQRSYDPDERVSIDTNEPISVLPCTTSSAHSGVGQGKTILAGGGSIRQDAQSTDGTQISIATKDPYYLAFKSSNHETGARFIPFPSGPEPRFQSKAKLSGGALSSESELYAPAPAPINQQTRPYNSRPLASQQPSFPPRDPPYRQGCDKADKPFASNQQQPNQRQPTNRAVDSGGFTARQFPTGPYATESYSSQKRSDIPNIHTQSVPLANTPGSYMGAQRFRTPEMEPVNENSHDSSMYFPPQSNKCQQNIPRQSAGGTTTDIETISKTDSEDYRDKSPFSISSTSETTYSEKTCTVPKFSGPSTNSNSLGCSDQIIANQIVYESRTIAKTESPHKLIEKKHLTIRETPLVKTASASNEFRKFQEVSANKLRYKDDLDIPYGLRRSSNEIKPKMTSSFIACRKQISTTEPCRSGTIVAERKSRFSAEPEIIYKPSPKNQKLPPVSPSGSRTYSSTDTSKTTSPDRSNSKKMKINYPSMDESSENIPTSLEPSKQKYIYKSNKEKTSEDTPKISETSKPKLLDIRSSLEKQRFVFFYIYTNVLSDSY